MNIKNKFESDYEKTLKTVATVALAGFVVASCSSLNKMKRLEKNIAYKVTPEMLEAKGGQVDLKIDATIPAKYFNKKVTLVATPVLKFQNGGEKAYEPKTFQGEKVQGNNEVVPYATEKTVNYSGTVPFEEGMRVSGLYVKFQGSKGKKSADYESRKIADGVIATATMVNNAPAIASVRISSKESPRKTGSCYLLFDQFCSDPYQRNEFKRNQGNGKIHQRCESCRRYGIEKYPDSVLCFS